FRLAREGKELLVAARVVLADRGKTLVFVAEKQNLAEVPGRFAFHPWDTVEHGALKILLHQRADHAREARVDRERKVEGADGAALDQLRERRERPAEAAVGVDDGVIGLLRWAEDAFDGGVVVEERE